MKLNDEQIQAVNHLDGPCVVIASPGSGKTKTLTSRVINLIKTGVSPANILCLTFTNKAAEEMRSRIASQTENSDKIWISTFHKLCVALLRKYGKNIGLDQNFSILVENDQTDLIKKIFRMHEYETNDKQAYYLANKINNFREDLIPLSVFISALNEEDCSEAFSKVATEYLNTMNAYHVVDFSGILYQCYKLLNEHEKVTKHLANKFKYILVDEWQDTNTIQYEIIKLIAKHHSNLFTVGDRNQNLYKFRGARSENLNRIFDDFPNTKKITLPKNYRSTSNILKAAQNLIRKNKDAEDTVLESTRGSGEDIKVYQFENPDIEANYVCTKIKQLAEEGMNYGDCAVLYRTNALSKLIEQKCRYYEIPYKIVGGFSFYDRKEIKDILSYLTLCVNPHDSIAFHRAVTNPKRGIGDVAIGKIERACQQDNRTVFEMAEQSLNDLDLSIKGKKSLKEFCDLFKKIKGENLVQTTKILLNDSGYLNSLSKLDPETFVNRKENLSEFVASVSQFDSGEKETAIRDFIQFISLQNIEPEEETDKISLLSVHASKGTEYGTVFIIGAEEKLFPHYRSMMNEEEGMEDERKCYYVAMTRSKSRLIITGCKIRKKFSISTKGFDTVVKCKPSRFIYEMRD